MEHIYILSSKFLLGAAFCAAFLGCMSSPKEQIAHLSAPTKVEKTNSKVLVIFLENESFDKAIEQPYLSKISKEGALLTNYHGVTQRSLPNYIAFVAGDTFGVVNDSPVMLDQKNIADLLEEHGKTWRVYAEDYPGGCFLKTRFSQYNRKQNPLINFKGIQESSERCEHIVKAEKFNADFESSNQPDFAMYVPNQINNGHDSDVKTASLWLKSFLDPVLRNQQVMKDTLVIVVFDENFITEKQNNIFAVLLGKDIQAGAVSAQPYSHYNMLRTVEEVLDIGTLGRHDAKANLIVGIWDKNNMSNH